MSTSRRIVWIDDNPDRASTAEAVDAVFIDVKGKDIAQVIEELLKGSPSSLVILDHILDKTSTKNPVFQKGSTIAEAIKEKWPFCPVVGITNVDNFNDIDLRTKHTYDVIFPFYDFGKYIQRIGAIKRGFALVTKTKPRTARKLVQLLRPPVDDMERLLAALPDDLKEKEYSKDASVASRLHDWVNHLLERPGFLFDELWAATFLGLTEKGFEKVSRRFVRGKYTGVFAYQNEPRWWVTQLSVILYKQRSPEANELSWHTGRRLPGIKKQYFSRCCACKDESPPETVAYLDAAGTQRHAMHLKCTEFHPHHKRELYFEDIRIMQGR